MIVKYSVRGINHEHEIDKLNEVYEIAKNHRKSCENGDIIKVLDEEDNTPVLEIKFYNRKGTRVCKITKYEKHECLTA